MIEKSKKKATSRNAEGKRVKKASLTKRALVRAVNKGTRDKAAKAMELMGYVMKVEDGWVIKVDKDGKKTRVSELETEPTPTKIIVD